jgi:hypothetical protein
VGRVVTEGGGSKSKLQMEGCVEDVGAVVGSVGRSFAAVKEVVVKVVVSVEKVGTPKDSDAHVQHVEGKAIPNVIKYRSEV